MSGVKKRSSLKKVYYRNFALLIVIPLLAVFAAAMFIISYIIRASSLRTIDTFQENVATALSSDIKTTSLQLSHFVYVNDGEFLQTAARIYGSVGSEQYAANQELERAFRTAMVPSQTIVAGKFYMKNGGGVYMKDDIVLPDAGIRAEPWYTRALGSPNTVVVGGYDTTKTDLTSNTQKGRQLILVTALAPDIQTDKTGSIELLAFFTVSQVGQVLHAGHGGGNLGTTVLLDDAGRLVYGDMGDERIAAYFAQNQGGFAPGTWTRKARLGEGGERPYLFQVRTVPAVGWQIVTFVEPGLLTQGFGRVAGIMVLVILCLLILFYLYSRYFLNAIIAPVHRVAQGMEQLAANDLDVQVQPAGQEEIRTLLETFNQMARSLKNMLVVNEEAQKRKHEAEIQALQSQINPHFLVNSLNSIRFMAQVAKFEGMQKMAEALISIVSCSFRSSVSFYTVREELDVLNSYLYLMRIRYSDGFEVEYQVDAACLEYRLPRLTLQPIVENSITHGFADMGDELGRILISAHADGHFLFLEVRDNGQGMTEAQIGEVLAGGRRRPGSDNTSIGLENVLARLRLNFGSAARMQITSSPGRYTCTVLRLPLIRGDAPQNTEGGPQGDTHPDRG